MFFTILAFSMLFADETFKISGEIPQKAEVTRFSDRVVIKKGASEEETVMFYNNKTALLEQGDEVRQGSRAISECRFEDDGRLRFFSSARYRFGSLSAVEHLIRVDEFTRILVQGREKVTLLLPGGTRLETAHSDCYIEREGNLIYIRNAGAFKISLSGHLVAEDSEVVPAGQTISIPLFDPNFLEEMPPIVVREVSDMIIKTTGGYGFEERPGMIIVSRPGVDEGIATIGGARIKLLPGKSLKLSLH